MEEQALHQLRKTTTPKTKKEQSFCESLPRLDLVSFLVLKRINLLAPVLEVPFRQSLHVSDLNHAPRRHTKH